MEAGAEPTSWGPGRCTSNTWAPSTVFTKVPLPSTSPFSVRATWKVSYRAVQLSANSLLGISSSM